jgi:hypothetical protein
MLSVYCLSAAPRLYNFFLLTTKASSFLTLSVFSNLLYKGTLISPSTKPVNSPLCCRVWDLTRKALKARETASLFREEFPGGFLTSVAENRSDYAVLFGKAKNCGMVVT